MMVIIAAALAAALVAAGLWWFRTGPEQTAPTAATPGKERKVLYWTDPMVPGFRSDKPGKSPFMDMELVPVYADEAEGAVVIIRPEIVQNLGVRTYQVTRRAPARRIVASGYTYRDARGFAVLVDLFDRDAAAVRAGLPAEVRVADLPGQSYRGTVERLAADLDIGARASQARVRLAPADALLRPNMLAEVAIQAPPARKDTLYIPREALIRTGTRTAVVLALGEGRFQAVEVVAGVEADDWIEIRQGLKEGDAVVTSGQFLIDSEANVRASFSRMEPPAPAAGTDPHAGHRPPEPRP
jgi:hypothetical protein